MRMNGIEAFDAHSDEFMARSLRSGDLMRYVEEANTDKKNQKPRSGAQHFPVEKIMNKYIKSIELKEHRKKPKKQDSGTNSVLDHYNFILKTQTTNTINTQTSNKKICSENFTTRNTVTVQDKNETIVNSEEKGHSVEFQSAKQIIL